MPKDWEFPVATVAVFNVTHKEPAFRMKKSQPSLYDLFLSRDLEIHKWHNYFWVYQRHFENLVGRNTCFLEIGVQRGGSAKMFKEWFGPNSKVIGLDIDPKCRGIELPEGIEIEIGNQEDPDFLAYVAQKHGPFDAVLDDGGHTYGQITTSFNSLFPQHLKERGVYMIEDVCCQFWTGSEYIPKEDDRSFKDFIWTLYEKMNKDMGQRGLFDHWHTVPESRKDVLHDVSQDRYLRSVSLYESIAVIEKGMRPVPYSEMRI